MHSRHQHDSNLRPPGDGANALLLRHSRAPNCPFKPLNAVVWYTSLLLCSTLLSSADARQQWSFNGALWWTNRTKMTRKHGFEILCPFAPCFICYLSGVSKRRYTSIRVPISSISSACKRLYHLAVTIATITFLHKLVVRSVIKLCRLNQSESRIRCVFIINRRRRFRACGGNRAV